MTVRYANEHKIKMSRIGLPAETLSMWGRIINHMPHGDPIIKWSNGRITVERMRDLRTD